MSPTPPVARHRRTWPQRLLILFNVGLVVACIGGASTYGWFYYDAKTIPRLPIADGVLAPEVKDPGDPRNFLLVGSDSREFTEGDDAAVESFGDTAGVQGQRADTIVLLRVDPDNNTAAMVSFPRDLIVENPATGGETRINAMFENGHEQLIETVKHNFDVPVHHYIKVDFAGFKGLVDAVGGVNMFFPHPARDWKWDAERRVHFNPSGLDVAEGCRRLDGTTALAYVRSRHYEEFRDRKWQGQGGAPDLHRIDRQQAFMIRAVNQAISDDFLSPTRLRKLLQVIKTSVDLDPSLSLDDIVTLGDHFQDFTPDRLQRHVVQVETDMVNGRYQGERYVDGPVNRATFNNFRDQLQSTDAEPSDVSVTVLNGTGTAGQAGGAATDLRAAGYTVLETGDNPERVDQTIVRHAPGQAVGADLVARHLVSGAAHVEDPALTGSAVVLVTGPDFAGLLPEPRPPAEAPAEVTTTTAPVVDPTTATTLSPAQLEELWYQNVEASLCQ